MIQAYFGHRFDRLGVDPTYATLNRGGTLLEDSFELNSRLLSPYMIHFQVSHQQVHVVMFIPGEVFFFAALQHDPELIEFGVNHNVLVADPTTLISLLRTVAYGWRQEKIAQNAQEISQTGKELYDRIATLAEHFSTLGRNLDRSVEAYNSAIGSLEARVLVSARRFKDLGSVSDELPSTEGVDRVARQLQAPELRVDT